MPFKYSCFISYRHGQEAAVDLLYEPLANELRYWLDQEIYRDSNQLRGGDFYNRALATALCKSICMIVVYTPTYFSRTHTYCAREYKAMELLEAERLKALGASANEQHGLIIPIVYRGADKVPKAISESRQCYFFEDWQIQGRANSRNTEFRRKIHEIAKYIGDRYQELAALEQDPSQLCGQFRLPDDTEIATWLEEVLSPPQVFPGRKVAV